jgi:hypothetical protein
MTSQRKIQANRSNSQKSSGPRTAEGKHKASSNSRKHGFAGLNWQQLAGSAEVEEFAKALCADQQDPTLLVQAHIIAQNELHRRAIRLRKLGLIERLMTQSESKYFEDMADKLLAAIFDNFKEHLPPLVSLRQSYSSGGILERVEEYFEGEDLTALRKFVGKFLDRQPARPRQVDECKAFELAAPEIDRLERYESRAWTRQMRAIRNFIEIKRAAESQGASLRRM